VEGGDDGTEDAIRVARESLVSFEEVTAAIQAMGGVDEATSYFDELQKKEDFASSVFADEY
jgi:hypothetical protein